MTHVKRKLDYNKPFCYMLVGPAGCGKTVVRNQLLSHPTMKDAVVISTDNLVEAMAIEKGRPYAQVFKWLNQAELKRNVKKAVQAAVLDNKSILVDRCNLTTKARSVITNLIPSHYNLVMVVMRYEEDKVLANIRGTMPTDAKTTSIENVINMFRVYQEPERGEYDVKIDQPAIYG